MSGHFSEMMDELSQKDREISNLRKLAKELSDCLLTVAPLGGSECFIRRGKGDSEAYYADPEFFKRRIREERESRHEALSRCARLEQALRLVRKIIVEGAETGFNCHDGDWAQRLFESQGITFDALQPRERSALASAIRQEGQS